MRDLIGIHIGGMIKDKEEVFLCFDWEQNREEEGRHIKVRYGNRKFFTTGFKTKDMDSIMLLRWKNDTNGHIYEMRKPELFQKGDFIRMDLTKEFAAMGLESREANIKSTRGGGSSHFYAYGNWVHIGEYGFYQCIHDSWGEDHLDFYFVYPGLKIGNSVITKIEIDTFDNVSNEKIEPMYEFMRTVMEDLSAVSRYTEEELTELFTKHFPETMYINIWCTDKLLRASIDHTGVPRWRFCREDIVDGVRNSNAPWIETKSPLEMVVKELGLLNE